MVIYTLLRALKLHTRLPTSIRFLGAGTPRGRFRRFVIRFCGSTYNTVNHLKIIPPLPPYIWLLTIMEKIFRNRIVRNWHPKPDYFRKQPGLDPQAAPCAKEENAREDRGTMQDFCTSASRVNSGPRRKWYVIALFGPDPCRNRACSGYVTNRRCWIGFTLFYTILVLPARTIAHGFPGRGVNSDGGAARAGPAYL